MWVPPTPFDDGYDVCGPKATKVGKESARTTVPCFIDLQKAYDSVDRTLLWHVLARFGTPTQMIGRGDPQIPRWDESMRAKR